MKHFLSKINKVGLFALVLGLLLIGTTSAFKGASLTPPSDGWYEISITNPSFPEVTSNQSIISTSPREAPDVENEETCAQTLNTGNKCFVYLDFESTATSIPATVADVDNVNVSITGTARLPL